MWPKQIIFKAVKYQLFAYVCFSFKPAVALVNIYKLAQSVFDFTET